MSKLKTIGVRAVMGAVGLVLAYFRIVATFSMLAAIGMFGLVAIGYPLTIADFVIFGGLGIAYYSFKLVQGFRDGATAAPEPAPE